MWNGLEGTLATLGAAVRPGGHIAVGEPFWRSWPLPDGVDDLGFDHPGGRIFMSYLTNKETLASKATSAALTTLGLGS